MYGISVLLKEEIIFQQGERVPSRISSRECKIFQFHVGDDPSIRSISLSLSLGTLNKTMVRMYASVTEDITTVINNEKSLTVLPSWLGLSAKIYDDQSSLFCINCTIKAIVISQVDTSYTLSFHTSKGFTIISESGMDIYELVRRGDRDCYQFPVKNAVESLEIYLGVFSGNPNLYVEPGRLPSDMTEFKFFSKSDMNEILTITAEQRERMGLPIGYYYICVYGESPSSYNLMVYMSNPKKETKIPITSGITRTMHVKENKFLLFENTVEIKQKSNFTFTLTSLKGNADLYVKFCRYFYNLQGEKINDCTLTPSDFNSSDVAKSVETTSVDSITLSFDPILWSNERITCIYLIAVYGVSDSHFSLRVLSNKLVEVPLADGVAIMESVGLHEYSYFSFVINDPRVSNVQIQLTSLSGDADLYVSRENPFCDANSAEKGSSQESFLPDTIFFTKEKDGYLNTTYHVSVYGFTISTFTIIYSGNLPSTLPASIQLIDGRPQLGSLNALDSCIPYKFEVQFPNGSQHDIRISLIQTAGTYRIYAGWNYIPTMNNYTWSAQDPDTTITIKTTDPSYKQDGTYHVLVTKFSNDDNSLHLFSIKYSTGIYTASIMEGYPESGKLDRNDYAYYKYYITELTGTITVTVTAISGDPDLFISLRPTNKMPSQIESDYLSVAYGADSIEIPAEEIMKKNIHCQPGRFSAVECGIYIGITCRYFECTYTLQVSRTKGVALKLIDGIPQNGKTTSEHPQLFLFSPNSTSIRTFISIQPKQDKVKAYANFISLSQLNHSDELSHMPTPDKHDMESTSRATSEVLLITSNSTRHCEEHCLFYIGVYVDYNSLMPGRTKRTEFSIVATNSFQVLIDSSTVVDYVDANTYKYYRFRVSCNNCILSISLTPLSAGDPDLFVNKGLDRLPYKESADFKSVGYRGEFLQISSGENFFKQHGQSFQGDYIFAVFGAENCTFSIGATTSSSKLLELLQGIPIHQEQSPNEIKYFTFISWKKANIKIKIGLRFGRVSIRANIINSTKEANTLDRLPSTDRNSMWSSAKSNTNNYLNIENSDPTFISNGTFLIGVEALEASSYSIVVVYSSDIDGSYLSNGQPYRTLLKAKETLHLLYVSSSYENINVDLSTFSGSVKATVSTSLNSKDTWRLIPFMQLIISTLDPKFQLGTYYIIITAVQDSDIEITITQRTRFLALSEGQPHSDHLENNIPQYYLYQIPPKNIGSLHFRFNIFVKFRVPLLYGALFMKEVVDKDYIIPTRQNSKYTIYYDRDLNQLGGSILINQTQAKAILIGLIANYSARVARAQFDIEAWTTGIAYIEPEHTYMHTLDNINAMQIFELDVNKSSRLFIEVIPCMGEVEFLVTKNLLEVNDRKFDLKRTELSKGRLFGHLDILAGKYFISVRALSIGEKGSLYSIRTILSNKTDVNDIEDYSLQNYGNIQFTLVGDELTLHWGIVEHKRFPTNEPVSDVLYSVYVSEEGNTNMATTCGLKLGATTQIARDLKSTYFYWKIKDEMYDKKLIFNVIASVPEHLQSLAYIPFYLQASRPKSVLGFTTSKIMANKLYSCSFNFHCYSCCSCHIFLHEI